MGRFGNFRKRNSFDICGVNKFHNISRWCRQKGIDLVSDLAPRLLSEYPDAQLLCIGPVIDVFGKLAAVCLKELALKHPGRVVAIPEFTKIPEFVFSGPDFSLIPSREEPFGLVAVEFALRSTLCLGSFVGGLGSVPGWYYPIESIEHIHLCNFF